MLGRLLVQNAVPLQVRLVLESAVGNQAANIWQLNRIMKALADNRTLVEIE
jgi:hypothetical protein